MGIILSILSVAIIIFLISGLSLAFFLSYKVTKDASKIMWNIKKRGPLYSIRIGEDGKPFVHWHKTEDQIIKEHLDR